MTGASTRSVKLYRDFHGHEPTKLGTFHQSFFIPKSAVYVGPGAYVLYDSRKVDPETGVRPKKPVGYIHEHDDGVKCYRTDERADGPVRRVPRWIWSCTSLTLMDKCPGFAYIDHQGEEIEAHADPKHTELYATPDGRALLVIADKKDVVAFLWGGRLGVEPRGIVH